MAKSSPKKTPMREQPPKERIKNYNEVPFGYSPEEAVIEAERCIKCKKPSCIEGCPVEIDIQGFIALIAEKKFKEGISLLKKKNILPALSGRVCPQETQCEQKCVLGVKNEPVAIGRLERFLADWEREKGEIEVPPIPEWTGKKVAVVGSGPSGITVAADLAQTGHKVDLFEALHQPGGVLTYGIPEFRLPKAIVLKEIDSLKKMGVNIYLNSVIGQIKSLNELLKEYDAVFLGTGAGLPWFLEVPGENLNGIYSSNEYLTRSNLMKAYLFPKYKTPVIKGKRVATVGGGNVAMDCARTALRLGAEKSIIIYRRSRTEMPARSEEVHHAEEEGVIFQFLSNPCAFIGDKNNWVREVECVRMKLGDPDASGRRKPVPIPDANFRMPIDLAIIAIGNSPNPLIPSTTPELQLNKNTSVVINPANGRTSIKGVFAGGDIVRGGATVILAMGDGRIASKGINEYLQTGIW
ncbi:MAG: glutamate synthase (NADPH), homotetrameric [Bacteroidetes bacterium CG23_combo_of_CG06-09_8_20_14_all_32_9]|nr:MAG: glutamate synthase (NADPH), homotetrameric [Bacteroidetes bacterium CG23_combo_of_CG06-09_8_20_14_all_32_9]